MSAADLAIRIAAIDAKLAPLHSERAVLSSLHDKARSREWIAANNVTHANVIRSDEKGAPWFGMISMFGKWIADTNRTERWAEWNGRIYSSAELMAGRMERDAPGLYEDVMP